MSCPSATLLIWTTAWWHGVAAADDVLDATQCWADANRVVAEDPGTATALELPGQSEQPAMLTALLRALRKEGVTGGTIALPVPGDVRGLGGKGPLSDAAVREGEAVVFGDAGIGLVPHRVDGTELRWTAYDVPKAVPVERVPISQAEHELAGAMRAAATALVELDVARHRPNVRAEIDALLEAQPRLPWPQGMPSRALRVLQRATEVAAILQVATGDAPGGALSASATNARASALAPLTHAVRFARCAAVNDAVRMFGEHAGKC